MNNADHTPAAEAGVLASLKQGIERTALGAHKAIQQGADAAHPAVDQVATGSHEAVDRASGIATHTADVMGEKGAELSNAQARLTRTAQKYVRDHPLLLLGVAAAVGYTASRYLSRS